MKNIVVLADLSHSSALNRDDMDSFIRNLEEESPDNYKIGVISYGRDAMIEKSLDTELKFNGFETEPRSDYTNQAAGLRAAQTLLGDKKGLVLVLGDGADNLDSGDVLREAKVLYSKGSPVYAMQIHMHWADGWKHK